MRGLPGEGSAPIGAPTSGDQHHINELVAWLAPTINRYLNPGKTM
jgi:hypothetical protein